jgi:glutamate--cysteine ligase
MARSLDDTDLLFPFMSGITAPKDFRLGVELEYFPVHLSDLSLVPYDSDPGIRDILYDLASQYGWSPVYEGTNVIELLRCDERITLEPGGVIEYSSPPLATVWHIERAMTEFLEELTTVVKPMAIGILPLGFHPFATPDEVSLVPKQRYHIMDAYMPQVGTMGRHMMKLTCSTQVTIDFYSEADAMRKMQLAVKLTPFFVALSANSVVQERRYTHRASTRVHAWAGTDPSRTGFPDFLFQKNVSFMDYVEWALDVPIYFLERWGQKMVVGHPSFRNFLERGVELPNGRGRTYATPGDWQLHLTTVFPWVRLRNYIELRAFDINASDIVLAIAALVKGLFYSASSLNAVEALVGTYDKATVEALLQEATRYGLEAQLDDMSFRDMLSNLIDIAKNGLCDQEKHEYIFLKPFEVLALKRRAEDLNMLASLDIERYMRSNLL